jgi:hypothetical protein
LIIKEREQYRTVDVSTVRGQKRAAALAIFAAEFYWLRSAVGTSRSAASGRTNELPMSSANHGRVAARRSSAISVLVTQSFVPRANLRTGESGENRDVGQRPGKDETEISRYFTTRLLLYSVPSVAFCSTYERLRPHSLEHP